MLTENQIRSMHKEIHNEMTAEFYKLKRAGLVDDGLQAAFDASHAQNWIDMQVELIAAGHLTIPEPGPTLADLEARVKALEQSREVI